MAFCLAACLAHGQDFTVEWNKLREKKDSSGQRALLQRWETQRPADAEMFIAQFNYYANRSRNYTEFTRYLVETIHYANSIKNAWTWKEGKALPDAPAFF